MPDQWEFSPKRLWGHRARRQRSRSEVAAAIGITPDSIKSYEYGLMRPSLPIYLSLCAYFGISPNDLCRRADRPYDPDREYDLGLNYRPRERNT